MGGFSSSSPSSVLLIAWVVSLYNRLVTLRNRYKNAFSQIDVQLKRRYDLIPNLVETAKGYMRHERETLEAVIAARNHAVSAEQAAAARPGDPAAMRQLQSAEAALTGALGRLFAVAEAYPDLKANQNMQHAEEELTSTENRVAFARQAYNDARDAVQHRPRDVAARRCSPAPSASRTRSCWLIEAPQEREAVEGRVLDVDGGGAAASDRGNGVAADASLVMHGLLRPPGRRARRSTRRLVLLFALAVVATRAGDLRRRGDRLPRRPADAAPSCTAAPSGRGTPCCSAGWPG